MSTAEVRRPRDRSLILDAYKWNLGDIYDNWLEWDVDLAQLEEGIDQYKTLAGTLHQSGAALLAAFLLGDRIGQLAYKVYLYASLMHDQDQRDNEANARRQRVQAVLARWQQASSWFNPELIRIGVEQARAWMTESPHLAVYRFAIEEVFRQQEHVLDERGERLLSLTSRLADAPDEAYQALSTADAKFPDVTLSSGETITMSYGQYRAVLATRRQQSDRRDAYRAHMSTYAGAINTYAALYHGVCQRDTFRARARGYPSALDAALHANNIPRSVVDTLIATTREGVAPLRRYHQLRRRALKLDRYSTFDFSIPLVDWDRRYPYDSVLEPIATSVAVLGDDYQARMWRGFRERWIDVYENDGKRSGAYSAAVYGVHPYMLLNWADTLDDVFTLAHEMGHTMHTLFSQENQPFIYSDYTIFVAEVPSTLSEFLLLDLLLERATTREEQVVLLQHAIDNVTSTFYTQVLFADFELAAHRTVEADQPLTASVLGDLYRERVELYYGDAVDIDDLTPVTWARIPHFFGMPYYVYQYATCFASSAAIAAEIKGPEPGRSAARQRFLDLLASGSSDHPMQLLQRAGVDLSDPGTVRAIVSQLEGLVARLEGLI
jgi:oligoendopeptidase F